MLWDPKPSWGRPRYLRPVLSTLVLAFVLLLNVTAVWNSPPALAAPGDPATPEGSGDRSVESPRIQGPQNKGPQNKGPQNKGPQIEGPPIEARGAALLDLATGEILWQRNGHRRLPMASTTKIVTALVALEHGRLDQRLTVPPEAARVEGSRIYLEAGETYTLEEMLYATLLSSANDAALTIATNLGESVDGFAGMMNAVVEEMGLPDAHFVNPHGLQAAEHYSSAVDLAHLAARAMKNPDFRRIAGTTSAEIPWPVKNSTRTLDNHNQLLKGFPGATGVKNGYTTESQFCLVGSATRNGREVVAVILGSPTNGQIYADMTRLLNFGLDAFQEVELVAPGREFFPEPGEGGRGGDGSLRALPVGGVRAVTPVEAPAELETRVEWYQLPGAPVPGQVVGQVKVLRDGGEYRTVPLVAAPPAEADQGAAGSRFPPWVYLALAGLVVLYARARPRSRRPGIGGRRPRRRIRIRRIRRIRPPDPTGMGRPPW